MIARILVATDGLEVSTKSVEFAADLAKNRRGERAFVKRGLKQKG